MKSTDEPLSELERARIKETGRAFTEGVLCELASALALGVFVAFVAIVASNTFGWRTDDSDKDGWNRSKLRLHTDNKTGIQYFTTSDGGMHVRLDTNGQPMRVKP